MKTILSFVLLTALSGAWATDIKDLLSGKYLCTLDKPTRYMRSKKPHVLEFFPKEDRSAVDYVIFKRPESYYFKATYDPLWSIFRFNKNTFPINASGVKWAHVSFIDESADLRSFKLFLSLRKENTQFGAGVFDCKAEGKVVLLPASRHAVECVTDSEFLDNKVHTFRFTVLNLYDNVRINILPPEGVPADHDEWSPIQVSPANDPLSSLNENLEAGIGKKGLVLKGDSDGFFYTQLTIFAKGGFTRGEFRIWGDEYDPPQQVGISCKVEKK